MINGLQIEDNEYHAVITPKTIKASVTAIDYEEIMRLFVRKGALLLRGFDVDKAAFKNFTESICISSVFNGSVGRKTIDQNNNIQTVNLGNTAFAFHPELAREPWKPDVCFFCCLSPPSSKGETTFCDGVELVTLLPSKTKSVLKANNLTYNLTASKEEVNYWLNNNTTDLNDTRDDCPFTFHHTPKGIIRSFTVPALHKPMWTNRLAFGNFLLFSRYMHGKTHFPIFENGEEVPDQLLNTVRDLAEKIKVPIKWQTGDLLMLDNSRYMHGRNEINDQKERLIISNFGYLKFAQKSPYFIDGPWRKTPWGNKIPIAMEQH